MSQENINILFVNNKKTRKHKKMNPGLIFIALKNT